MLNEGDIVAGRYQLARHLGDGGSAAVWKANDLTLQRAVAIKFLYPQDERHRDQVREQFLREARLACAVKHRNVINTIDFGTTAADQAYMVMEMLEGGDLCDRINEEPALTIEETIHTVDQMLQGLAAIHDAGVVHRDLKPENVYLEKDDLGIYPKILDFGIARSMEKASGRRSAVTTNEGLIIGTPEYMSPEQARGLTDVDSRSDLWTVGVMLFELLSDQLPFQGDFSGDTVVEVITQDPPSLVKLRPQVGAAISDVVARALSREREDRFQTAGEMKEALLDAARRTPGIDAPRPPAPLHLVKSRRLAALGWWVAAAAVVVAVAAVLVVRGGSVQVVQSAPPPGTVGSGQLLVKLGGIPEDGLVFVNGEKADGAELIFEDDGHARLIEVTAPGRKPWRVMHPSGNNGNYTVSLPPIQPKTFPLAQTPPPVVEDETADETRSNAKKDRQGSKRKRKASTEVWRESGF